MTKSVQMAIAISAVVLLIISGSLIFNNPAKIETPKVQTPFVPQNEASEQVDTPKEPESFESSEVPVANPNTTIDDDLNEIDAQMDSLNDDIANIDNGL